MRYAALVVIWILFWLAGIIAPLVAVLRSLMDWSTRPVVDTFHAQNRTAATVLGFEGDETISAECGKRKCILCRALCKVLSFVLEHANHCDEEAKR